MDGPQSPIQLARALNRAFTDGHLDEIGDLIDEKAEIASFLNTEHPIVGADAIIEATRRARERGVYHIELNTVRELSKTVAVGTGSVRYLMGDGHSIAHSRAAWLWKFRDGRLLRVAHFRSEDEACSAFDPLADDFSLPSVN